MADYGVWRLESRSFSMDVGFHLTGRVLLTLSTAFPWKVQDLLRIQNGRSLYSKL